MVAKDTFFVGTYTRLGASGIYTCQMEDETGRLEEIAVAEGLEDPSFLTIDPTGEHLYAVTETADSAGEGTVCSFAIEIDGSLTLLNQQSTGGADPCHLVVDATDSYVLVTNYIGGSVCMLPISPDGRLGERCDFIQHCGSSVNADRQEQAHAHSVTIDLSNSRAYVCDLGMDKILIYRINAEGQCLDLESELTVEADPGQGPRHFDIHPSGKYCYVINELGATVAAYSRDSESGKMLGKQLISTLPDGWDGPKSTADIHVSRDGRFLYGSNRGHDSIAIFAIDALTGELSPMGHTSTRGKTPRNFALSPNNKFLIAANQDSGTLMVFAVAEDSGQLEFTGHQLELPGPVCIQFAP